MRIPPQIPGLKALTILLALYAVVWISWEGSLGRDIVMGVGTTAVFFLHILQKKFSTRTLSLKQWLLLTAFFGLLAGLISGPLTLTAMIFKTGLHAHGPEFTLAEFQWVMQQIPLWTAVGLLIGLGLGMLTANK